MSPIEPLTPEIHSGDSGPFGPGHNTIYAQAGLSGAQSKEVTQVYLEDMKIGEQIRRAAGDMIVTAELRDQTGEPTLQTANQESFLRELASHVVAHFLEGEHVGQIQNTQERQAKIMEISRTLSSSVPQWEIVPQRILNEIDHALADLPPQERADRKRYALQGFLLQRLAKGLHDSVIISLVELIADTRPTRPEETHNETMHRELRAYIPIFNFVLAHAYADKEGSTVNGTPVHYLYNDQSYDQVFHSGRNSTQSMLIDRGFVFGYGRPIHAREDSGKPELDNYNMEWLTYVDRLRQGRVIDPQRPLQREPENMQWL